MKIMFLANYDAGLYRFRRELVEELLKEHEVFICLPDGNYVEEMVGWGCKFVPCELLDRHGINPLKELKLLSYYKKVLKEIKPDIVFTYTIKPNAYGGMVCGRLNIPYVVNVTGLGTAVENAGLMQMITLMLYKLGVKKAQKVFFQNTTNRDFMIKKGVLSGAYDLLPGSGVNLKRYLPLEYPNKETVDFVFVGRTMKEKGIENYLDAAEYIRGKYPETRFHICGEPEQDYTQKLAELHERGIIVFHGNVRDMTEIYKDISCTVHPSYYPEGLSNVLLESCASARPIITTNRAGCREVVDEGINGYICNQNDTQDLIKQIERFMCLSWDERKKMGLAGRAKVEKEFSRDIVIQKYFKELEEV